MSIFTNSEREFAVTVARLVFCNPFCEDRVELERQALGKEFDKKTPPWWSWTLRDGADRPNVLRLTERVYAVAEKVRQRLADGVAATDSDLELYDDLIHYVIYYKAIACSPEKTHLDLRSSAHAWDQFDPAFEYWMNVESRTTPSYRNKIHVFAYLSQVRRAFFNIYLCVIGRTRPIANLRARIWQSIFTTDMRRYRRTLFNRMHEVSTLVTGPTGTGKELVARAVGLSQYRSFAIRTKSFLNDDRETFFAINLSAFSPTLIESELFGHEKGAFTGAESRRTGFLEAAGRYGCVFLDEIGEVDAGVQVKLLRVLQSRQFQRIGSNKTIDFLGKFVSATNRDLLPEIRMGHLREDFYYRICSDVIHTVSLAEQFRDDASEIGFLVSFLCKKIAPDETEDLSRQVLTWLNDHMPDDYHWPGNMRELEQCVRNVMIHNDYTPQTLERDDHDDYDSLAAKIRNVDLTADELLGLYCEMAYRETNSYEKAAELLKLDRRTVKAKIVAFRSTQ